MRGGFPNMLKGAGGVVLSTVLLAGCAQEPDVPVPPKDVAQSRPEAPPPEPSAPEVPVAEAVTGMKQLSSNEAPFACDLLTAEDIAGVVGGGAGVDVFDATQKRRDDGTWTDSTCLFGFGENKDIHKLNLKSRFVRVDVYTEASLQQAGWGSLQDQWMVRSNYNQSRFDFRDGVWAAWVESDHPPDPALLIRQGEVMFELAHYPPRSSAKDSERNQQIERIARILLDKREEAAAP